MQSQLPISVCMPMYNASRYLRECIDSILSQTFTDFELLIVDDGSEDDSVAIVESYTDPRIRLIRNRHDYIGSLNLLLKEARGKYIARMDADDVMLPYRLQVQYDYMETHLDVDILGSGMHCFGDIDQACPPFRTGEIGYLELINTCPLYHPTVMMRLNSIRSYNIHYEAKYIYAEDYALWAHAIFNGLKIHNIKDILLKYRINPHQLTRTKQEAQRNNSYSIKSVLVNRWLDTIESYISKETSLSQSHNKLTVVIPFYNEGIEVVNTIKSIRQTAMDTIDIIVINDHSDDGIDYESMLKEYDVCYIQNPYRMGPAVSKEKGVQCCVTPYFILLDAHMRFYQNDWAQLIINELKKNDAQILCCQTRILRKKGNIVTEEKTSPTYGAFVYLGSKNHMPNSVWNPNPNILALKTDNALCVLGASYASSKTYWNRIGGYHGLIGYGCEEVLISLKAWLEGGKCKLLSSVSIGHIYKESSSTAMVCPCYIYNYLFISHLLFPTSLMCKSEAVIRSLSPNIYLDVVALLRITKQRRLRYKNILHRHTVTNDFEYLKRVNYVIHPGSIEDLKLRKQIIPTILNFCKSSYIQNNGIEHGKMALVILYFLYYRESKEAHWKWLALSLLSDIKREVNQQFDSKYSFSEGLAGIGWGLIYLLDWDLIQQSEISTLLNEIDIKLSTLSPKRLCNHSFEYGHTGIACYVSARLGMSLRYKVRHRLHPDFISELQSTCLYYLDKISTKDLCSYSINRLMSLYDKENWSTMKLDFSDIISLPTTIPKNIKHWSFSLSSGSIGYAIHLLTTIYHVNQNK